MAFDPAQPQHQESGPLAGPRLDMLLLEYGVCAMSAAIAHFGTLSRAILFAAAARACGPFEAAPVRAGRPVSVNALAASLRRPFETTRRNANALIAMGLLVRSDGGLQMPTQAITDPRAAAFSDACHDLLVRLIEDVRASNLALPAPRTDIAYDPRAGVGIAFDLLLAGFECRDGDDRNLIRIALLTAIEWANARFGGRLDGTRQLAPVKPSMIARTLGLPYATAARNLDQLVRDGALERSPDGLIVPRDQLSSVAATDARLALGNRARQLLGRLAQAGFPLHQPALGYIRARPPLPALG
ncbi:hypothetical protein M9978_02120 [Sphingomonas sp. MG17]|uniref:Uncharacterized protein n=1 Tax=Sphingomonas tagetis TaxID=2949092 RepID=A0A9X2HG32_9SPHN|nr:hypothetical protein [Sphingomonas tagetis]MCP3729212.1 hypothetical protein [Sphingomonas tagetis]